MAARRASSTARPDVRRVRVVLFVDPRTGQVVEEDARVRDRRGRFARPERVIRYVPRPVEESEARARQYAAQVARARVRRERAEELAPKPERPTAAERRAAAERREAERREAERRRRLSERAKAAPRGPGGRFLPRRAPAPTLAEPPAEAGPAPRVEHPKRPERLRDEEGRFATPEGLSAQAGPLADRWRDFFKDQLTQIRERMGIEGYHATVRTVVNSDNSVDAQITVSLPRGEDPREALRLLESMRTKGLWPENAPGAFISVGVSASDARSDSAALKRGRGLPAWSHPVSASRANEAFLTARGARLRDKSIGIVPSIEDHMTKAGRFEAVNVRLHWSPVGEKPDRPTARKP